MIYINKNTYTLKIPRVNRCIAGSCDKYNLALKNTSTKDIIVYKLHDWNIESQTYYYFDFYVPDWLETGTYEAYLFNDYEFFKEHINPDNVYKSERIVKKSVTVLDDMLMVEDGKLIVSSQFYARVVDMGKEVVNMCNVITLVSGDDTSECGNMYRKINIIQADHICYPDDEATFIYNEPSKARKEYKIYKK